MEKQQPNWALKRLMVVRLIAQHKLTAEQIAKACKVSRKTVFNYRDTVLERGVEGLLKRDWKGARKPTVRASLAAEFEEALEKGKFRQASDAQAWLRKRTRKTFGMSWVRKLLGKHGGKLKSPRKSHAKKPPGKAEAFKKELPEKLAGLVGPEAQKPIRVWVLDEHRYGLLPVIRRVWGRKGVRVHAPYATKYKWGYLHEAMEVDGKNACEVLFTPAIDQDVHAIFLKQIAQSDAESLHVVIQDQAGFHITNEDSRVPENVRLLGLPPYSPELNPVEQFGNLIKRQTGNRLYQSLEKLEGHIEAVMRKWSGPESVASLMHDWLVDKVNAGVQT